MAVLSVKIDARLLKDSTASKGLVTAIRLLKKFKLYSEPIIFFPVSMLNTQIHKLKKKKERKINLSLYRQSLKECSRVKIIA